MIWAERISHGPQKEIRAGCAGSSERALLRCMRPGASPGRVTPTMIVLLFALLLAALAYCAWRVAKLFLRGWKDRVWIWRDANRAGFFLLVLAVLQVHAWAIREDFATALAFALPFCLVLLCGPYLAYGCGRLCGMWGRVRGEGRAS
ncbi:hypothetical protein SAMN04515621_2086 [Erythrobacter sp. HL-111]|nr:MAG: Cytidylyltransferase family [Erythrobacteraceae bacterium HL-111]SDS71461.1 hypothetical protein SAMN04515621_2086 [Erythrobacter sp. HL-111]